MTGAHPLETDPRWQALAQRGGLISVRLDAPDGWPHGPIPAGQKTLDAGDDRLSPGYCTLSGHRFLRAVLLLPIVGARTVFGFETWGSVSEENFQAYLAARARGEAFPGCFAWSANALPGFDTAEPAACNLVPGPPGQLPRLQPHPGHPLHDTQRNGLAPARVAAIHAAAGVDFEAVLGA